jgi:RsiW-degrading membrane proteinase PrsW (M82 family)
MSTQTWVALSGVIPALILMWIVDRADAKRPEPRRTRRLVVFVGMLSVIPALILEVVISGQTAATIEPQITFQGSSFQAYVVAAAIEEACKILVVYWVVWRRPEFDERMDGIVYASRAGLGFALVENVIYLLQQPSLGGQVVVWVARALLAVPGHAMWTGMIGAMAARRRFDRKGLGLLGGYLLAVAFHGTYDLSVFVQIPLHLTGHEDARYALMVAPVVLTVVAFVVVRTMARTALHLDDAEAATIAAQSVMAQPPV